MDPLGPLLAQIRAQAAAWKQQEPERAGSVKKAAEPAAGVAQGPADLLDQVVTAVRAIPPEVPDRRRRAFRLFLQSVLAREFAIQDVNAPGYQDLVDRVLSAMEAQEALRDAVDRAGDLLCERAGLSGG